MTVVVVAIGEDIMVGRKQIYAENQGKGDLSSGGADDLRSLTDSADFLFNFMQTLFSD